MTIQIIPTSADEPSFTQRTTLDGAVYVFSFRLNQRENTYRFDIALSDGTPIASGVKVVPNRPLLERIAYNLSAPKGILVAIAGGTDESCPGLGELGEGRRVTLYYGPVADFQ
jgi:hypothetical protein